MFVYWLMFLLPAWASFFKVRSKRAAVLFGWAATWLTLTLLIGYRYEVGGTGATIYAISTTSIT
jgi:hypothetical protein